MEEIQTSTWHFLLPITLAYATACGLYFLIGKKFWTPEPVPDSNKKWLDLGVAFLAVVGVLLIGQLYSAGWLLPSVKGSPVLNAIIWNLNNLIIYSPILLVLLIRKQSLQSIYLSSKEITGKIVFGLIASIISIFVFFVLRNDWDRLPQVASAMVSIKSWQNFAAVFLEGVALAFLFIRLKWCFGLRIALAIPAVLFAGAHLPQMIADGDPITHQLLFSLVTGSITVFVLATVDRSKDIIWLGVLHYLLDVVSGAFQ